ncbi:MAG: transcription termination factor NusA, partial [Desulfobacterales bacterium]
IVQRMDRGDIIVNLGHTEGVLPVREQVPREGYRRGDRIRAYIMDVLHETRGPQIILSRAHPEFLVLLFKTEVPEISEGIVSIMGAAREPGVRAKIAVSSNNSDIDPVGACVGMKGSRVQNVVQELRGEKIDIIPWHVDAAKYVCNALAPAEISRVIIDETNRAMEVIVPDEFLSIAIGKRGQNVRLASRLTGWHLDVQSETKYNETMRSGYESIVALPDVGVSLADALYEKGFFSAEEISIASIEDLMQVRDMSAEAAQELIDVARQAVLDAEAAAQAEAEADENDQEEAGTGETDDVAPGPTDAPEQLPANAAAESEAQIDPDEQAPPDLDAGEASAAPEGGPDPLTSDAVADATDAAEKNEAIASEAPATDNDDTQKIIEP